ncbi:MAG: metallophosphoesterase [bacterium]|nr:metallophosphoesterase [bacterium]
MKPLTSFIIFLTVVLTIYTSLHLYVFTRGLQAIPVDNPLRKVYTVIFLLLALSFIAGRILERFTICKASEAFIRTGSVWLAFMLYFFLAVLFLDLVRGLQQLTGFFPDFLTTNYAKIKGITALAVIVLASILVLSGSINAARPRLKTITIDIPKKNSPLNSLNIALVTDIHLGNIIRNSRLKKLVTMLNDLNADIVLLAGDIVDEDLAPVIEQNLGETLKLIKSKYGTFACTGNHEFIGGVTDACTYLENHSITVLRDRVISINNSFHLAGRDDQSRGRFSGSTRKTLPQLFSEIKKDLPLILMDHQPFHLETAVENSVDLQVSGHTHHGQLWPINFITSAIYEVSRGYKKIENTHFYVSTGFGTWGPPVRVGNSPEVVNININFVENN